MRKLAQSIICSALLFTVIFWIAKPSDLRLVVVLISLLATLAWLLFGIWEYRLGWFHLRAGRTLEAIVAFDQIIERDSNSAGSYFGRAQAKWRLEQYASAWHDCNRTLAIYPALAEAYEFRAKARLFLEQDVEGAISDLQECLKRCCRDEVELFQRATILLSELKGNATS